MLDVRGVQLSGTLAWLAYLVLHLVYLVGLQNRVLVFIRWTVSFVTRGRDARLITGQDPDAAPRDGIPRADPGAGGLEGNPGAPLYATEWPATTGPPTPLGDLARRLPRLTQRMTAAHAARSMEAALCRNWVDAQLTAASQHVIRGPLRDRDLAGTTSTAGLAAKLPHGPRRRLISARRYARGGPEAAPRRGSA